MKWMSEAARDVTEAPDDFRAANPQTKAENDAATRRLSRRAGTYRAAMARREAERDNHRAF